MSTPRSSERKDDESVDLEEAAEEGRIDSPAGTASRRGADAETGDSYEERQDEEEGQA